METEREFAPNWYTIAEFADIRPLCVYHKEQETVNTENNGVKNLHVLARADYYAAFAAGAEERYVLRISADDYYKLYINGVYVAQGQAPAYVEHYYYNEIDVTEYLTEGKNVFALHLYYQGLVNRVWNSGDNRFGVGAEVLSEASVNELCWRYRISEAYTGETVGYETQFLENFDSRRWDADWAMPDYAEKDFMPMVKANWADYRFYPQPTKMLAVYRREPKALRQLEPSDTLDTAQKYSNGLLLDMGEELTGMLVIRAQGAGGAKVIIRCGEELSEDTADRVNSRVRFDMRCGCCYEEEWTLAEGECVLEQYDYKAFRYVELWFGKEVQIKEIWASVRHYPMPENCTFTCEKKELQEIFSICKNAVKYGTQEGYLDCPTREKGQYLGDSIVTAHAQVWLTGSTEMLRKCIAQFAETSMVCKGLMAVAPGALMQEIADFSLLWSQLLLLDYQFTGDKAFLRQYYPAAKAVIEHFRQYEGADGMLYQVADKWNLVDWPENLRDSYDFTLSRPVVASGSHNVINALYVGALKTLSEIEELLGLPQSYAWEVYRESFMQIFYDKKSGLFVDAKGSTHSALHSNIYPLYFGFLEKRQLPAVVELIEKKGLSCGVFVSYFLLRGLAKADRHDVMYRLLVNESGHGWINMLREGATTCFEAWGKDQKWNTSLCHPWASAPIPLIIEELAGFHPVQRNGQPSYEWKPNIPKEAGRFRLQFDYAGKRYLVTDRSIHEID